MTRDEVQRWLDRYVEAWLSYDPIAIGELFSSDAEYRYHPWDEPIRGRSLIVGSWIEPEGDASSRDEPGSYDAHYTPYAVDGDRVVAVGTSHYLATGAGPERTYHNCFLLRFDRAGRCVSFTEFYIRRPDEPER